MVQLAAGNVVFVTGGASGIGGAAAIEFSAMRQKSYCACTLQVAVGFLNAVEPPATAAGGAAA